MTEIVSSPRAGALEREAGRLGHRQDLDLRARRCRAASSAGRTFFSSSASWGARLVEPEDGGRAGRARARDRQPHPVRDRRVLGLARAPDVARLDLVLEQRLAGAVHDPHGAAAPRSRTSCRASRTPRPSAPSARRSASCPSSPGRTRRARGSSRSSPRTAPRRSCRESRLGVRCSPSASQTWPHERIIAGIEASMITSLGTCRLVIPRSESTMASAGPSASTASISAWAPGSAAVRAPRPSLGETPSRLSNSPPNSVRTAWPKMIGSETFIIVAFRWTEKRTSCSRASATCSARNSSSAARRITAASMISPASSGTDSLSTVTVAVGGDVLDPHVAVLVHGHRPLGRAEVAVAHRRHVRSRVRRPRAHRVRMRPGERLHRRGRAAVGVALAQHRVDGASPSPRRSARARRALPPWRASRGSRAGRSRCPAAP